MKLRLAICFLATGLMCCSDTGTSPGGRDFNLKFGYGFDGRNVLNTYENTYTKDLVLDGTVTVSFVVPDTDIDRIRSKMIEINFFAYPDTFMIPTDDTIRYSNSHLSYAFDVTDKMRSKHLLWSDVAVHQDTTGAKLKELILLIQDIVESNPRYSQLSPARGGYN